MIIYQIDYIEISLPVAAALLEFASKDKSKPECSIGVQAGALCATDGFSAVVFYSAEQTDVVRRGGAVWARTAVQLAVKVAKAEKAKTIRLEYASALPDLSLPPISQVLPDYAVKAKEPIGFNPEFFARLCSVTKARDAPGAVLTSAKGPLDPSGFTVTGGASKLAGEGYAHAFAKTYGLRTVAIRFGNVYGPWSDRKRGVFNVFFESIHNGVPMVIYGDGSASRDYVHVDDISNALRLALEKDVPGGMVLHAASGVETTVTELADLCRRAAGVPDHPIEYRPKRAGEVGRNFASYDLARKLIGYAPSVTREVGIPRTWQWFQEAVFTD